MTPDPLSDEELQKRASSILQCGETDDAYPPYKILPLGHPVWLASKIKRVSSALRKVRDEGDRKLNEYRVQNNSHAWNELLCKRMDQIEALEKRIRVLEKMEQTVMDLSHPNFKEVLKKTCPGCRQNVAFCEDCKKEIRDEALQKMCSHKERDEIGGDCEVCAEIVAEGGRQYKRGLEQGRREAYEDAAKFLEADLGQKSTHPFHDALEEVIKFYVEVFRNRMKEHK